MLVLNLRKYWYLTGLVIAALVLIPLLIWINNGTNTDRQPPPVPRNKRDVHGEYLSWAEVNRIFPKYAYCTVTDLEKKKKFAVQRRGGTYHADVQPLTAQDTKIMKDIYGGEWSWKRRAVIVELEDGRKLAASMNGMPHGNGAIRGNKFNGHFCIHFRDSKTHIGNKIDTAHQLMVWKAAGILEEKIAGLEARESLQVFIAAVDQGEMDLVSRMLAGEGKPELVEELGSLDKLKLMSLSETGTNKFRAEVRFSFDKSKAIYTKCLPIRMIKHDQGWKIPASAINTLLNGEETAQIQEVIVWEEDEEEL